MSDRIEKSGLEDFVVVCLENGGPEVLKYDWKLHISPELQQGETHKTLFECGSLKYMYRVKACVLLPCLQISLCSKCG